MKAKKPNYHHAMGYRIPQFDIETNEGFKHGKSRFEASTAASPLFGSNVKDVMTVPDVSEEVELDVRQNYDFARSEENKAISKEELIAKYGTEYPEFKVITPEERKRVYGDDITIINNNIKEEPEVKSEQKDSIFGFVKTADDILDHKPDEDSMDSFDFSRYETEEEPQKKEEPAESNDSDDLSFSGFSPVYSNIDDRPEDHTTIVRREQQYGARAYEPKAEEPVATPAPQPEPQPEPQPRVAPQRIGGLTFDPNRTVHNVSDANGVSPSFEHVSSKKEEMPSKLVTPKSVDKYKNYKLPPRTLFKKGPVSVKEEPEWLFANRDIIDQTLLDFGIPAKVNKWTKGPTFSRYEVALDPGVRVSKVNQIYDNLQMNLGAKSLRIQAPIPGKTVVGIEVPNKKTDTVYFGDIVDDEFYSGDNPLKVALGKDIDNNSIFTRIDKWPHGLIAGTSGSGKSVSMNTILVSILLRNKPDEVKLLLVDPKTVELMPYNEIPHLVTPVINDPQMASEALKWACEEMDRRYLFLQANQVRNIGDYNEKCKTDKTLQKMPYIVIVIDELADLMAVAANEIEDSIKRLTAKARAAGMNLLVATQRPTVDVIKGTIKANIATRVAFKTTSQVDSQTILDETGAESLLGRGDMLLKADGEAPMRLQGAFLPDDEIYATTSFIKQQCGPDYLFTHDDLKQKAAAQNAAGPQATGESPEMLYSVALFCINSQGCSVNAIQVEFGLGFNRASKIVSNLEAMGIVSAKSGTKAREVLVDEAQLAQIFNGEE